jgi:hypothetical protein
MASSYVWATKSTHEDGKTVLDVQQLAVDEDRKFVPVRNGKLTIIHEDSIHKYEIDAAWRRKHPRFVDIDTDLAADGCSFSWDSPQEDTDVR